VVNLLHPKRVITLNLRYSGPDWGGPQKIADASYYDRGYCKNRCKIAEKIAVVFAEIRAPKRGCKRRLKSAAGSWV
jgi:hypothetical protein